MIIDWIAAGAQLAVPPDNWLVRPHSTQTIVTMMARPCGKNGGALGAFLASLGKRQVPRIRPEGVPLPVILRREPRGAVGMTVRESLTGRTFTVPADRHSPTLRGMDEKLQWGGKWSVVSVNKI